MTMYFIYYDANSPPVSLEASWAEVDSNEHLLFYRYTPAKKWWGAGSTDEIARFSAGSWIWYCEESPK